MNDVQHGACFAGEEQRALNGVELRDNRPRRQEVADAAARRPSARARRSAPGFPRAPRPAGQAAAASFMPSNSVASSARGNSGSPESHMKALNPTTPRCAISAMSPTDPGTSPPHSPKSVTDAASSAARFRSNSRGLTVHGVELSGMSKNSVPPPAASARLPVAAPSHSVRPGLVEVEVHVDHAGQDRQAVRIDLFARHRQAPARHRRSARPRWRCQRAADRPASRQRRRAPRDQSCALRHLVEERVRRQPAPRPHRLRQPTRRDDD